MWQQVARGNHQQIHACKLHSPFGLMLLRLGDVTIICTCNNLCMCVCMHASDLIEGIYSII